MADQPRARIQFDPRFTVAEVPDRLFGSFVEHLGRCVYTGIYEPDHPTANADGLRRDVLDLVTELGPTMIRYPGGNFVSGYRWEDGVGPKEDRPRRLDLAWAVTETNQFGLGEFMRFCRTVGVEPNMAVNLGTRGLQEALDLFEYANHPSGTYWSDLRRSHGDEEPYGIKLWCLGNEMDGPWQIGQRTAAEYGRVADQTARALRMIDRSGDLDLVACGSSSRAMPQFGAWEHEVLTQTYESVDYISAHAYYHPQDGDLASFMASAQDMELFIDGVTATADAVGAKLKTDKKINISFDEWNVWYQSRPHRPHEPWGVAPRQLEDVYSAMDAVVFGSLMITLLRRCDRVTAACLAQLVNVIAPIMTEPGGPAWRQTTFYPFAEASRHGRGTVLHVNADSPAFDTARFGAVPALHSVAVANEDGTVTVFAVNRDLETPLTLEIDASGIDVADVSVSTLTDTDRDAANTLEHQDRVVPVANGDIAVKDGVIAVELPAMSWNTIRIG